MTYIFGHRGSAGNYPENTMLSFMAAKKAGADGIELDVQMTKDGELVVIHDETLDRTTTGTGYIHTYTFSELLNLDASYTFTQFKGQATIPLLSEVLEWAKTQNIIVNIELKNGIIEYPGIENKTIELIYKYNMQNDVILSSFNHYSLVECNRLSKEIKTAVLYMEGLYKPWEYAGSVKATGIHPHYLAAQKEIISQSQGHGIDVRPFTVNDQSVIEQLITNKCAAIITDFPELAVAIRNRSKPYTSI